MTLTPLDRHDVRHNLAVIASAGLEAEVSVLLENWCNACGTRGYVDNPIWNEFGAAFKAAFGDSPLYDGQDLTRAEDWEDEWWTGRGYPALPPEELQCPECEGHGRTLTREGLVLVTFLQRWGFTQKEG